MIGKLRGKIDSQYEDFTIIDVGGVGYKVFCSAKTLSNIEVGASIELYIETHVREDHIHLFGFRSIEEQDTFILLQSVKGVGVRVALAILSYLTPYEIQLALASQDKNAFGNVSGIGKKLAERIVVELKDKFISTNSLLAASAKQTPSSNISNNNNIVNDAVSALVNLGINRSDAYQRVGNILSKNPSLDIPEVIKLALKNQI